MPTMSICDAQGAMCDILSCPKCKPKRDAAEPVDFSNLDPSKYVGMHAQACRSLLQEEYPRCHVSVVEQGKHPTGVLKIVVGRRVVVETDIEGKVISVQPMGC